jgi:hypothetical protein
MKQIKTILLAQLAVIAILLCISAPAWANLAANTQILNKANLSYWDGTQTKVASAEVTVTVTLVCAAPTLTPGGPQTTSYNGPATTLTDSFTITSGSNGPDTYNLSAAVSGSTNTGVPTAPTAVPVAATVQLGASVTTVGSTGTVIVVPADGNLPGEMPGVNGIAVGDTVVINGNQRDVIAISDNTTGTSTITLNAALDSGYMPGSGVVVGERKTVNTTVTAGTITVSGVDVTVSATLTATSCSGSGAATSPAGPILNTYTSGIGTLTKYVKNVSTPSGTGTPYYYGGVAPSNAYYLSGVTAKPGDTLEYLLVSKNTSLTGPVSSAVVTDAIPTAYVSFKAGAYGGAGKDITYVDETSAAHILTAAATDDAGVYAAPNLTVNVGGLTPPIPPAAGGTIPLNSTVLVLYQVTVNP